MPHDVVTNPSLCCIFYMSMTATVVVSLEDGEDQTSHPDVSETTIDIQPNQRQRQRQDSDTVGLAEEETALTYNFSKEDLVF